MSEEFEVRKAIREDLMQAWSKHRAAGFIRECLRLTDGDLSKTILNCREAADRIRSQHEGSMPLDAWTEWDLNRSCEAYCIEMSQCKTHGISWLLRLLSARQDLERDRHRSMWSADHA